MYLLQRQLRELLKKYIKKNNLSSTSKIALYIYPIGDFFIYNCKCRISLFF